MAEGARSLALAGALLVRTLAQFAALGKCRPKPNMSFSGIEEWFTTNNAYLDMSQPSYRYQPSSSSLKKFVSGADGGRHRTVKNLLALRMWMEHCNDKLPAGLQDDYWGLPAWYAGMEDVRLGCNDFKDYAASGEAGGAAAAAAASASPPCSERADIEAGGTNQMCTLALTRSIRVSIPCCCVGLTTTMG